MSRNATLQRKTKETEISVSVGLDGRGECRADTGIPFFDHMLELFCRHGRIDADIRAKGDLQVDFHHTVEDVGITLGKALAEAMGDKRGIARYGQALLPMDESLAEVAIDVSGRPYLVLDLGLVAGRGGSFGRELVEEFLRALAGNAGLTLHVSLRHGSNLHHVVEAVFKALGVALSRATALVPGRDDIPSTKGVL